MQINSAIIVAGGFGTRLKPLINNVPKTMALIKNKPFLEYLLIFLLKNNINNVIVSIGYLGNVITSFFGNKYGKYVEINKTIEYRELSICYAMENSPLGTGGAIKNAIKFLDDDFSFVLNGDSFFDISLSELSTVFFNNNNNTTIALKNITTSNRYGNVKIDNNNLITGFKEKGKESGLINAGIYVISKNIFNDFPDVFSFEIDYLQQARNIYGKIFDKPFIDIGLPEDYVRAGQILLPFSSTLFLDRDGVINKRIVDGYVKSQNEFVFLDGVFEAICTFLSYFKRIIVVSNQQGINKGLIAYSDVENVNNYMLKEISNNNGKIDNVYFSPYLEEENHSWRKPGIGMALQAKNDYPDISFEESIMIGDSISDMIFGKRLNMKTVLIGGNCEEYADICCDSLYKFSLTF